MNYDLTIREDRKRFVKRANQLLRDKRDNVCLSDESKRTVRQNNYIHILFRILALETGTTEQYAKQVYFKELANPDIFVRVTKDKLTGKMIKTIRSTCDIEIKEMSKAIQNFLIWASSPDINIQLPAATLNQDGSITFASDFDRQAYHQAVIKTSVLDEITYPDIN